MGKERKFSFCVEDKALGVAERPRRFLEAFAAVLEHSNFGKSLQPARCSRLIQKRFCSSHLSTVLNLHDQQFPCHIKHG